MHILKRRFAHHIRTGCLHYAFVYTNALSTFFKFVAIAVCSYDLVHRESSSNQTVLLITAVVISILVIAQFLQNYAELKARFSQHELIRKSRKYFKANQPHSYSFHLS